ncbi:hypothetical protein TTRE_0000913301 [Trichuris trichiura]|uniref:Uncharacterized protein n=1 Tax=Trichuris trichiura TaxID=36087 RepID=A0A077ZK82_TRITR|nr:hypothetical protein TTRE_0000913301 [Trichuris trichiura]
MMSVGSFCINALPKTARSIQPLRVTLEMLLLFLLGAFTRLLSALPVNERELLTRELDAGPYSSTCAKRSLNIISDTGYEQHTELEHRHLIPNFTPCCSSALSNTNNDLNMVLETG